MLKIIFFTAAADLTGSTGTLCTLDYVEIEGEFRILYSLRAKFIEEYIYVSYFFVTSANSKD